MSTAIQFDSIRLSQVCQDLRQEVREFIHAEIESGSFDPFGFTKRERYNREFARKVGAKGWIGMTWPKAYGGQERTFLERYVVTEEFRAFNAPTGVFFTADRQSGPVIIRYASEEVKQDILPRIIAGECMFCIGMSEPDSGSDLFAAKCRATETEGGYLINGSKVWTSGAHTADYMIGLFRTAAPTSENRRHGLTNFIVDLKNTKGITTRPIHHPTGHHDFNEVIFEDAFIPQNMLLGSKDEAWKQATSELAYERSGPERFLETFYLLPELVRVLDKEDSRSAEGVGRLVAQLHTLRRMSVSVNGMLQAGKEPTVEGSLVKNLGTIWEQELPAKVRNLSAFVDQDAGNREDFDELLRFATQIAPKLTIQGGTTEVLRGIIARGLGLR